MSTDKGMVWLDRGTTDAKSALGELYIDADGNHYRYMQADGAVTSYQLYNYNPITWQIDALADAGVNPADTNSTPICVWDGSSTALADDEYAWVKVGPGQMTLQNDASGAIAANEIIYLSATAGRVTNVATAGLVRGLNAYAAISGDATGTFYATIPLYAEDLP